MSVCLPTLGCSRRAWDWETYFKLPGHFHTALDIHMAKRTWQDNINSLIGNPAYRHPSSNRRKWKQDDKNHWTTTHFLSRDRHTPCNHWNYDLLAFASTKGSTESWRRCYNFELEPKSQEPCPLAETGSAEVNGRARGTTSTFSGSSAHAQHRLSERQSFQPYNI